MALGSNLGLSIRDLKRFQIIQQAIDNQITQKMAASVLGLSHRQIKRLVKAVRQSGAQGVVHKAKGKPSNIKYPDEMKNMVLALYRDKYLDFGPTFACEKLLELDGVGGGEKEPILVEPKASPCEPVFSC